MKIIRSSQTEWIKIIIFKKYLFLNNPETKEMINLTPFQSSFHFSMEKIRNINILRSKKHWYEQALKNTKSSWKREYSSLKYRKQ